ncbi:MAG TPA: oligopeptide:H+ symporter, partial [Polyangiaceae bacterium]|nr:oligopeptide:H+ symporter [Polyangiaceae bacterium]
MTTAERADDRTLFGHPVGLYTLFFAEMWERFSYYGMRALLVLYMIKGFLRLNDGAAYGVYGAYTALVYATPFIGGMLADRLLGSRRAVVLGGLLMAAGHLLMTVETQLAFYGALALLIAGNGFFKPNISTIVGSLYPAGNPKRDGGFTIFYMGINLGAAMSPLICGYVGETYGWHYGFGLATVGMLIGVAVFVAPIRLTQILIGLGAVATAIAMLFLQNNVYQLVVNLFVGVSLVGAAGVAFVALGRGGLPKAAGAPPAEASARPHWPVYAGVVVAIPVFALLVQRNTIAGYTLTAFGVAAFGWLIFEAVKSTKVERERLFVVLILMFFSLLFWAFFEQAGSSINNFTDRNVDRVIEARSASAQDVGQSIELRVP